MNIAGLNLYRVLYLCPPVEIEFQKLVVAKDESEARFLVPGQFKVELIEGDISMVVTEAATQNTKLRGENEKLRADLATQRDAFEFLAAGARQCCDRLKSARAALLGLARGTSPAGKCWCDVAIGDPRMSGHSASCDAALAAIRGTEIGEGG